MCTVRQPARWPASMSRHLSPTRMLLPQVEAEIRTGGQQETRRRFPAAAIDRHRRVGTQYSPSMTICRRSARWMALRVPRSSLPRATSGWLETTTTEYPSWRRRSAGLVSLGVQLELVDRGGSAGPSVSHEGQIEDPVTIEEDCRPQGGL